MIDCYYRTNRDQASISRASVLKDLECESHSIALSDELAFNSRTLLVANTTSSPVPSQLVDPSDSVGATASANPEETAAWIGRASATSQTSAGSKHVMRSKWSGPRTVAVALIMVMTVLAL